MSCGEANSSPANNSTFFDHCNGRIALRSRMGTGALLRGGKVGPVSGGVVFVTVSLLGWMEVDMMLSRISIIAGVSCHCMIYHGSIGRQPSEPAIARHCPRARKLQFDVY